MLAIPWTSREPAHPKLDPQHSSIPMNEDEWLRRLAEVKSEIGALSTDHEPDSDAA